MLTAVIKEQACIGCGICLDACPFDAIIGAKGQTHTVLTNECIGCKLCVNPCPVDCIDIIPVEHPMDPKQMVANAKHRRAAKLQRIASISAPQLAKPDVAKKEIKDMLLGLKKTKISEIFKRFQQYNPQPTTELKYNSDFELLIAVMLSAQSTDTMVNKITAKLFVVANTPEQIIQLTAQILETYIKSIGLFRTKARNIYKTCQILIAKFNSAVPKTRVELESLPGVGRKTANVILNTLWQQPTIAVDTHVLRVANRIGLVNTTIPLTTELELLKTIPEQFLVNAHHWLILHGRYVCKAINPQCKTCLIIDLCAFNQKNL